MITAGICIKHVITGKDTTSSSSEEISLGIMSSRISTENETVRDYKNTDGKDTESEKPSETKKLLSILK